MCPTEIRAAPVGFGEDCGRFLVTAPGSEPRMASYCSGHGDQMRGFFGEMGGTVTRVSDEEAEVIAVMIR